MHKAKNCIVTCMDFRLQKAYADFIAFKGWLGSSDLISVAGCSRDLVKPINELHKTLLLRQIELSIKLHDSDTIIFLDHQDCGGYAQDGTIPQGLELDEDKKQHIDYANKVKKLIHELFPTKGVKVYFVQLDGKVEEIASLRSQ